MLHYVVGGTVITMIGSHLLNALVSGTVDILYNSASFAKNGTESNKMIVQIRKQLDIFDIPIKLQLVTSLMTKAPDNDITKILEEGLVDLTFKIKTLLESIDYEISKHNAKWFSGYRNISIDDKIIELESLIKILDGRITLLMNSK